MSSYHYITANQGGPNTGTGDTIYEAQGVTISGDIDMRYQSDDMTFNGGGSQTVHINGGLFGSIDDYFGATSGNDGIFVGTAGYIDYNYFGAVELAGGGNSIVNNGTISTSTYAQAIDIFGPEGIDQSSADTIINTGSISGTEQAGRTGDYVVDAQTSSIDIVNSGSITASAGAGAMFVTATGNGSTFTNSGAVTGGVNFSTGSLWASNSGTMNGADTFAGGGDFLLNTGTMNLTTGTAAAGLNFGTGADDAFLNYGGWVYDSVNDTAGPVNAIAFGNGNSDSLYNTSTIAELGVTNAQSNAVLFGSGANDLLSNDTAGVVQGNVALGGGVGQSVANAGRINGNITTGGGASDVIRNTGAINGNVTLGNGALDDYYGATGTVNTVTCGTGGDVVLAGQNNEQINGGAGADIIYGGAGGDQIHGGGGADYMFTGAGADRFVYTAASDSNLTTGADRIYNFRSGTDLVDLHALGIAPAAVTITSGPASTALQATVGADTLTVYFMTPNAVHLSDIIL